MLTVVLGKRKKVAIKRREMGKRKKVAIKRREMRKRKKMKRKMNKRVRRVIPNYSLQSVVWIVRRGVAREVRPHPMYRSFSRPPMVRK